ncbi:MAG: homocysteine S-methyltransferase family protein [Oscillospiraceae bacterium]|nr:homocysteine S-methyltransferase family protein [Oscillospiraceae bacterium]
MSILDYLKEHILFLDGGMGTLLQQQGLQPGEFPERWNLSHPEVITNIHRNYFDAGCHVVNTNTFGANTLKFSPEELDAIVKAAVENARAASRESTSSQKKWVALDIGPTGKMLKPYGDLDFEDAVSIFAQTVRLGVKYGADLIFIETMADSYETKAALLAAKENSDLPVFVSNAYGADGKLMTGADPAAMVALLEGMGADAIGANCSLGPQALRGVVEQYLKFASVPVLLKPNAGLPRSENGNTVFDVLPEEFASDVAELIRSGVRIAGGCCGTTPDHIAALTRAASAISPVPVTDKELTVASSYTHAVVFGDTPVLIGERINPTGKKRFKEALKAGDMDYILNEGIRQEEQGVHILDVNVGLPEIDETALLTETVCALQAVTSLPLQIDTTNAAAMEAAMRRCNGKPLVNSVNGTPESMAAIFPLVKKYGGVVVALTLDEAGIPATAAGRLAIAGRILAEAESSGIPRKDILFDPLALTVSADGNAARVTLDSIRMIREELGCHTVLGVSNISFGLPQRDLLNGTFFSLALGQGLSAAIMNPFSSEMQKAYHSYLALMGLDPNCVEYISFAQSTNVSATISAETDASLNHAIVKGMKEQAALLTRKLLAQREPLDIVQKEIIPALDIVGVGFENKTVYLPQLLMSAEAAKSAFEVIKAHMSGGNTGGKCSFVLATVKGDIHDIGKNIVKLLLENYGFTVYDLGRDVAPEIIVEKVVATRAPIAGLSALMTTTVPAMAETIRQLREHAPWCKVIVGGAVLNAEYAETIGADKYAKDAMETVRYAEMICNDIS